MLSRWLSTNENTTPATASTTIVELRLSQNRLDRGGRFMQSPFLLLPPRSVLRTLDSMVRDSNVARIIVADRRHSVLPFIGDRIGSRSHGDVDNWLRLNPWHRSAAQPDQTSETPWDLDPPSLFVD